MYYHYHHRQCYRQQIDSQRQRITTMDRLEQCAPFIAIAQLFDYHPAKQPLTVGQ